MSLYEECLPLYCISHELRWIIREIFTCIQRTFVVCLVLIIIDLQSHLSVYNNRNNINIFIFFVYSYCVDWKFIDQNMADFFLFSSTFSNQIPFGDEKLLSVKLKIEKKKNQRRFAVSFFRKKKRKKINQFRSFYELFPFIQFALCTFDVTRVTRKCHLSIYENSTFKRRENRQVH